MTETETPLPAVGQEPPTADSPAAWTELPTDAPTIGSVRPLPPSVLSAGTVHRTPSVVLDGLRAGRYSVAAASLAGTAHLLGGTPRQDAYELVRVTDDRLVIALADGLGSKPHSQVAARWFGEHVAVAVGADPGGTAKEYLARAADSLASAVAAPGDPAAEEVGVVVAVAVLDSTGVDVARVGDTTAFVLDPDGGYTELFPRDDAGFVNVVPAALPDADAVPEVVATELSGPLVLATDGLAADIRNSPAVRAWLAERWRVPLGPFAMADSLRYRRQGSHDDRTAVVVWASPGPVLPAVPAEEE